MPKFKVKFEYNGENFFGIVDAKDPNAAAELVRKQEKERGRIVFVLTTKVQKEAAA